MMTRIALAKKAFSLLVGLAQRDVLPIHVVNSIFWAKVFPVLDLGSWLYVLADSAEAVLNELHVSWAKQLLGACPWHNSALVTSELGWEVSGFHLAVVSMAARRARLWMLPAEDLYGRMFRVAHSWPFSWAAGSLAVLLQLGILDLPYWTTESGSLAKYRQYVRSCCVHLGLRSWVATAERHTRLPRYLEFQSSHSGLLQMVPDLKLHWEDGQAVRAFCRLRAGIIRLTHRDGRLSRACIQQCIFCGRRVRNGLPHVLCRCSALRDWTQMLSDLRREDEHALVSEEAREILACPASSPLFVVVLRLAKDIDDRAKSFWHAAGPYKYRNSHLGCACLGSPQPGLPPWWWGRCDVMLQGFFFCSF